MVPQLNEALAAATADGGPRDALQSEIEWRQEIKALLALATAAAKKITKHTLPDRAVFYVSGAHHESYGSTGHPHDILAVTDDAADVSLFYGRKGMNVAFKVQHFRDVIKLIASSIWTATPTTEQRKLAVLVLNAWFSHATGESTNHSNLICFTADGPWERDTCMLLSFIAQEQSSLSRPGSIRGTGPVWKS